MIEKVYFYFNPDDEQMIVYGAATGSVTVLPLAAMLTYGEDDEIEEEEETEAANHAILQVQNPMRKGYKKIN